MNEFLMRLTQDARLVNVAEHLLYPLLEQWIAQKNETIRQHIRSNATDRELLIACSELAFMKDFLDQLKNVQRKGNSAIAKLGE